MQTPTDRARMILAELKIESWQDFHALTSHQVEGLLSWADLIKYRTPANANGSRARYFHALLIRRATRPAVR